MNEKTALALSGHDTKDEFIQAVRDGDPVFPSLMSAKLVRKIKTLNDEDGTPSETYVNINILEASPQEFTHARTESCVELIDMLRTKGITASSVLPASLGMIAQSKLYPLLVQYPVEGLAPVSCQKTWILIKATKKSRCTERPPYQVITEDIQDGFEDVQSIGAPSPDQPKQTYKIITMCNEKKTDQP